MGQHVTPPTHCVQYPKEVILTGQLVAWTNPQSDFCLWGYIKSEVFKSNPELKEHIREEMQSTCQSVNENFRSRLQQC